VKKRVRLKKKLDAAITNIQMMNTDLSRDQASDLKSAENALSKISYDGLDFDEREN
jgi:hypothetical protein